MRWSDLYLLNSMLIVKNGNWGSKGGKRQLKKKNGKEAKICKQNTHTHILQRVKSRIGIAKIKCHVLAVTVSIHQMFNVPPCIYHLLI